MNLTAILQQARRHPALSQLFSLFLIAAAVALRMLTPITLSYVTFYPAVILATAAGGWVIGAGAMLLSTLCVFLVIAPLTGRPGRRHSRLVERWRFLAGLPSDRLAHPSADRPTDGDAGESRQSQGAEPQARRG